MKQFGAIVWLWCATSLCGAETVSFESLVYPGGTLWEQDKTKFMRGYASWGFVWQSDAKESARTIRAPLTFLEMKVWEASVLFAKDHPSQLTLFLYTRGDAGRMSKEEFQQTLKTVEKKVSAWLDVGSSPVKIPLKTLGTKRKGRGWKHKSVHAKLVWSYATKDETGSFAFRPEYIRVELTPSRQGHSVRIIRGGRSVRDKQTISLSKLRSNITRPPNGDVWIEDIPMVDQGQKGYCAVAVAERVFRYLGVSIDQHEMAQLASSSATGGTNSRQMMEVLKRAGSKLECKTRVLEEFDFGDFVKLVKRYNRLAKKERLREIELTSPIDISAIYQKMETELLREARLKFKGDMKRFERNVMTYIGAGTPVAWSVMLGKIDEGSNVSGVGGHMRLIVGYNQRTSEILFSDTWGRGHELKRMSLDDAWTITTGMYVIEPRYTRR